MISGCMGMFLFVKYFHYTTLKARFVCIIGIGFVVFLSAFIFLKKKLNTGTFVMLMFVAGFTLRLAYILYTPVVAQQNGMGNFENLSGHASYIQTVYSSYALPKIDLNAVLQFYQPPLHYILSAVWIKFLVFFGVDYYGAVECVQILTMFYSSICMILSYKIFKAIKLTGAGLVLSSFLVAFHPTFITMSGSITNDALATAFLLGIILCILKWFRRPRYTNIIQVALTLGLGMATKRSVAIMIIPIIIALILVLYKHKKHFSKLICQYLIFIISFPLGLFYSIRNLILYKLPILYMPDISNTNPVYIGDVSIIDRLFNFKLTNVYFQSTINADSYDEFNPTVALFKTASFGDNINQDNFTIIIKGFGELFFIVSTLVALLALVFIGFLIFKRACIYDVTVKAFFTCTMLALIAFYYISCLMFPVAYMQNVLFIAPAITIGAGLSGTAYNCIKGGNHKYKKPICYGYSGLVALFVVLSIYLYASMG